LSFLTNDYNSFFEKKLDISGKPYGISLHNLI
jgi:hypothetical protein